MGARACLGRAASDLRADHVSSVSIKLSGPAAKTKVCGPRNQDNIQIYPRRMEQFVALNLCCHRGLNQKWLGKCDPITKVAKGVGHVDKLSAYGCLDIGGDLTR